MRKSESVGDVKNRLGVDVPRPLKTRRDSMNQATRPETSRQGTGKRRGNIGGDGWLTLEFFCEAKTEVGAP